MAGTWRVMAPVRARTAESAGWRSKYRYLVRQTAFSSAPFTTVVRLAAWRIRCWLGLPATVYLPDFDIRLALPARWRGVAKLMYVFRDRYEKELGLLRKYLVPGAVFADVGANLGIYSLAASRIVGKRGMVLAFEPAKSTHNKLLDNMRLNRAGNMRTFRMALASGRGPVRLYHHPDPGNYSLGRIAGQVAETVASATLDSVFGSTGAKRLDLMKIDVEGAEELVLKGSIRVLRRYRPAVIFEMNSAASESLGLEPCGAWNMLGKLGYRMYLYGGDGFRRAQIPPVHGNVVALAGRRR